MPDFNPAVGRDTPHIGVDRGGLKMLHDMASQDGVLATLPAPAPTVALLLSALPAGIFRTALQVWSW